MGLFLVVVVVVAIVTVGLVAVVKLIKKICFRTIHQKSWKVMWLGMELFSETPVLLYEIQRSAIA
jgi:hypothetical protein